MIELFANLGRAAGVIGLLLCLLAGALRLTGHYSVGSFQTITLLQLGIAGLAAGCFLLLWGLSARR